MRAILLIFLLLLPLAAVQAQQGGNYLKEPLPDSWQDGELFNPTTPDNDLWWQNFEDARLDSLIDVAIMNNPSVLMVIENMKKAKAVWRQAQSNLLPQVGLQAGWQRTRGSGNIAETMYRETYSGNGRARQGAAPPLWLHTLQYVWRGCGI